ERAVGIHVPGHRDRAALAVRPWDRVCDHRPVSLWGPSILSRVSFRVKSGGNAVPRAYGDAGKIRSRSKREGGMFGFARQSVLLMNCTRPSDTILPVREPFAWSSPTTCR